MQRTNDWLAPILLLVATSVPLLATGAGARRYMQNPDDPHRPACSDVRCLKISSYLRSHYCGASPFGNGPDDGCEIKVPDKPSQEVKVLANFKCEYDEAKQVTECRQNGQPPADVRTALMKQLHDLGLPANQNQPIYFLVWQASAGWWLTEAYYARAAGDDLWLCDVMAIIYPDSQTVVVRKLPFQKTDVDVTHLTEWSPVDLADVSGDGHVDVIVEGDEYENHWLEVVRVQDRVAKTIFSGLGYYL